MFCTQSIAEHLLYIFEHFFFTTGKTLRRGPMNPHEMSKSCPIRFSGRMLAPCVLEGHGGHSALLQEERGREAQLQTPGMYKTWDTSVRNSKSDSKSEFNDLPEPSIFSSFKPPVCSSHLQVQEVCRSCHSQSITAVFLGGRNLGDEEVKAPTG